MRIANLDGRPVVVGEDGGLSALTLGSASPPLVRHIFQAHSPAWAAQLPEALRDNRTLRKPTWACGNVYGLGYNYRSHVDEGTGDKEPLAFLKSTSALADPFSSIQVGGDEWDYEVELVLVIGEVADRVAESDAWSHVGAVTIGQDISDRALQRSGQLCMAKSMPGSAPVGPWLVTTDDLGEVQDLAIECSLNGESLQSARLGDMTWSPEEIVARLSHWTRLMPGDLIFTGTPAGVGVHREPRRFLQVGDVVDSSIHKVGRMTNECV